MESGGIMCEGEWSSFNGTSNKEADFMAQLFSNYSFPSEQNEVSNFGLPSSFWHCHDSNAMNVSVEGNESSYYCSDTFIPNAQNFPQGSSYSSDSSFYIPTSGHEEYYLNESNPTSMTSNSMTMDYCMVGEQNTKTFTDNLMEEAVCVNEGMHNGTMGVTGGSLAESPVLKSNKLQHKRKIEMPELHSAFEEKAELNLSENVKKCSRVSDVPKSKWKALSKKKQKLANASVDEEETNVGLNGQTSSSYSSEDDSNASQELNGGTTSCSKGSGSLNLKGKARASRGSATDPQSLYARKRRERINERLRILQNLVPNGTKVDISTMLEEAVQYVKFLQIQIKLLSSDDMWMYAPIAYNGMNIGLNLNIPPSQ